MTTSVDRFALISDIHGNLPALTAVLADIDRRNIRRVICLGDLVGKGASGAAVIDRCLDRCEAIVHGNWDVWIADCTNDHPTARWHRAELGSDRLAVRAALPYSVEITVGGQHARLFHASPFGVFHRVLQGDPVEKRLAMFDSTDLTGRDHASDVVAYGDIHVAYIATFGHRTLVNVGSVGNPLDQTRATYAVIEGEAGMDPAPLSISLLRVPYDIEGAIAEAAFCGMPELDEYAGELRTAKYRGSPS